MPNMFRNFSYPGTDFHEMNLEWLVDMCNKFIGLALNVSGDHLRLVNDKGEVVSSVTVSYATKALTDQNGKNIDTYIFSVAGVGDTVVLTHGDGTSTAITVPYAEKAKYDLTGHEIEDYIYNVQVAGDALRITHGDGTIVDITIPYAVKATKDANGKNIDTYAATLTAELNKVVLRDSQGRLLSEVTVPYAVMASKDDADNLITSTYGHTLTTGTTTVKLISQDDMLLSEITVPYSTDAGHADEADHATLATDATNAIETVAISGDHITFTTYGGQVTTITAPYAVKAQKDDLGNTIKTTYVAGVTNDAQTGKLQFRDAMGNIIVELLPTVDTAVHDDYGNAIADYIKSIVVSSNSDYVTVTHGDGDVDTLTIHYSDTAWKDTNGNVIKNFYISYLECVEDVDDGHYKIVAYNGDTPRAELFRFEVTAYSAQTDINGKDLTSYVADVDYNANQEIEVTDGAGNTLKTLRNALDDLSDVEINNLLATGDLLGYDGTDWTNVELQVALDDLTDVTIDANTLADGDVLTYDAQNDIWVNKPAGGASKAYTIDYKIPDADVQAAVASGVSGTDFAGIVEWCCKNGTMGQWRTTKNSGEYMFLEATTIISTDSSEYLTATASNIADLYNKGLIAGITISCWRDAYNSITKTLDAIGYGQGVSNEGIKGVYTQLGYITGDDCILEFYTGNPVNYATIRFKKFV